MGQTFKFIRCLMDISALICKKEFLCAVQMYSLVHRAPILYN